jgi:glutaredoxin
VRPVPRTLTFYTRKQCGLCIKGYAVLERALASLEADVPPFEQVVIDLDTEASAEKRAAYDYEVPVLELDGRKVMKLRFDEARLLRLLRDAG